MNKLLAQIAKFGIVGVICFFIDWFIYLISNTIMVKTGIADSFRYFDLISGFLGFSVSVVANYILSFRFVFERRDDMSRKKEFTIFLILSIIGLGVNELCLFVGIDLIYMHWAWLKGIMSEGFAKNIFFKFGATGVVMVYNFITRKIFLEQKD